MSLRIAVQMDDIAKLYPKWDNTLCLIEEAQKRGHRVFCYQPKDLVLHNGELSANGFYIRLKNLHDADFYAAEPARINMRDVDIVLMRQDPPYDMHYITAAHLLEHIADDVLVLNNPKSVRDNPEKILVTHFPQFMADTIITSSADYAADFFAKHGDVVIKPLYHAGGKGVIRAKTKSDFNQKFADQFANFAAPLMIQEFLPGVIHGDKRAVFLDGELIGVFVRGVREGNFWTVGQEFAFERIGDLTPIEQKICGVLSPVFKKRDLFFVGIDLIDGKLTEINVTSPAGIREIDTYYGTKPQALFWDKAEAKRLLTICHSERGAAAPTRNLQT